MKVVKNKMAPPFKQAEFDIMFAEGISKAGELVDIGVDKKVIEKSGAWYSYKGERLGQGRDAVRDFLITNQPLAREIEAQASRAGRSAGRAAEKNRARVAKEEKRDEKRAHKVGV